MASASITELTIANEVQPQTVSELQAAVQTAYEQSTPIYPVGGGTSLGYGLPVTQAGTALRLGQLAKVIDYPARDMTVTVEAGVTIESLQRLLETEGQFVPLDVPHADRATLGGVIATNFNGPRRFGYGTVRDYVIGVRAVDGRGTPFAGGGRVVKNVAGYDFCKLLTGSLGTLGIIYEVTLKLRPRPQSSVWVVAAPDNPSHAALLLDHLAISPVRPVAIEWLVGPEWSQLEPWNDFREPMARDGGLLAVGLEGTLREVDWMVERLEQLWQTTGVACSTLWRDLQAQQAWKSLAQFPDHRPAPLVVKVVVVPSHTLEVVRTAQQLDADCSVQAHAGSGVVVVRLPEFPTAGLTRALAGGLGLAAAQGHGHVEVLSNPERTEMTRRITWGGRDLPAALLSAIKDQFDPRRILNRQRFVYHD